MSYLSYTQAEIRVSDRKALLVAHGLYGGPGSLVGAYVVQQPLTPSQLRRLPKGVRDKVRVEVPS